MKADFTKEQAALDSLANQRKIYKSAAEFMSAPQTKDFAKSLVHRILALRDSYIEKFDAAEPDDALSIARYQEARRVCNQILLDFDSDACKKAIEALDKEIKKVHDTMDKKKETEKQDGGFNSL